jgi:hypothetical protein
MEASIDYMKACCEIQDNRYWKLWLYPGEVFDMAASTFGKRLVFSTKDGFTIELQIEANAKLFHGPPWAYFKAFVTIPEYILDLGVDPQKNFRFHPELTTITDEHLGGITIITMMGIYCFLWRTTLRRP